MKSWMLFILVFLLGKSSILCQVDSVVIKKVDQLFDIYFSIPQNNTDSALVFLDSALMISKQSNYVLGVTDALREKGFIFSERGEYVDAMQVLIEALKYDEKIKNQDGMASSYNLIGLLYHQQEKMNEALSYFIKSKRIFVELKDEGGIAMVNGNLGMIYRNLNKFDLALNCYFNALTYNKKLNRETSIANLENNIGNIYKDLKQWDKALEYFMKAKEGKTKNKQFFSLISTLSNIGDVYVELKKYNLALDYYTEALEIAKEQNSLRLQKDVYLDLSNLYKSQGNFKLAYDNFKLSTNLKDSIISEKYNTTISELKVKYDTDKKEKENIILTKDNELKSIRIANEQKQKLMFAALSFIILLAGIFVFVQFRAKKKLSQQLSLTNDKIKNQNTTLKVLNKELIDSEENLTQANYSKDQLLSMLSHDLYNPITSVINFSNLTLETSKERTKEELCKSIVSINNAAIPLQDLLDNILQWARIQKNKFQVNYEEVSINSVVTDIMKLYQPLATFKKVKILFNPIPEDGISTDRLMVYFIIRNIVNNAVKFSPKEKEISIQADISEKEMRISVKDQGMGFNPDILQQLNDIESSELKGRVDGNGIGLSVSKKFIRSLNGSIEFKNRVEGGAETVITLRRV